MKKSFNYLIPIFIVFAMALSGCSSKTKEVAILDEEDIRVLANIENPNGSAQTAIEIIPVPQLQQGQLTQSVALPELNTQQPVVQPTRAISSTVASREVSTSSGEYTFEQKVQVALTNANLYSGAIDGKIGAKTREAIKEFQVANGLKADGLAGKQTWAVLKEKHYNE